MWSILTGNSMKFKLDLEEFHTGSESSKPLHLNAFSKVLAVPGNDSCLKGKVFELLEEY